MCVKKIFGILIFLPFCDCKVKKKNGKIKKLRQAGRDGE